MARMPTEGSTDDREVSPLFLDLNRPEYFGSIEAIQSELAWAAIGAKRPDAGRAYERIADSTGQDESKFVRTADAEFRLRLELERVGIVFPEDARAERALLDGCRGVKPVAGRAYPAVPVFWPVAFWQDARGLTGKRNPANFSQIIGKLWALASESGESPLAPAAAWAKILASGDEGDMGKIAQALSQALPTDIEREALLAETPAVEVERRPPWLSGYATPFTWFKRSWGLICSPSWRTALPRRRWCDWAACILRTAIGMSFLWEMMYYRRLCESIAREGGGLKLSVALRRPLLTWIGPGFPLSDRDVNGAIIRTIAIGTAALRWLENEVDGQVDFSSLGKQCGDLDQVSAAILDRRFSNLQSDDSIEKAKEIVTNPRSLASANNVRETIVYALQCRGQFGPDADYYSLLSRRSRRFLVVEPGPEWLVVMASLAAEEPGLGTTLGEIMKSLGELGIEASRQVVVSDLERAGMTRSSHDADDALEVRSGF